MIDTHCHLYQEEFAEDLPSVIQRAKSAGVDRFLVPGVNPATCKSALSLAKKFPGQIYACVGIHPNYASQHDVREVERMIEKHKKHIAAIGEIGLDFYRTYASREDQLANLEACLRLAKKYDLPIVIHNRDADDRLISVLDHWYAESDPVSGNKTGVFHAFGGSQAIAEWGLEHGFLFGIGGAITYKKNHQLRSLVKQIGLEHLVLETDAPYMAPTPYRGKRNAPEYLKLIAAKLAEILETGFDQVVTVTTGNAENVLWFKKENAL